MKTKDVGVSTMIIKGDICGCVSLYVCIIILAKPGNVQKHGISKLKLSSLHIPGSTWLGGYNIEVVRQYLLCLFHSKLPGRQRSKYYGIQALLMK